MISDTDGDDPNPEQTNKKKRFEEISSSLWSFWANNIPFRPKLDFLVSSDFTLKASGNSPQIMHTHTHTFTQTHTHVPE